MKFNAQLLIQQANAIAMKKAEEVVRQTLVNVAEELTYLSPIGHPEEWARIRNPKEGKSGGVGSVPQNYEPGEYKANWQYSQHSPKTDILDERDGTNAKGKGSPTFAKLEKEINESKSVLNTTHYFANNVPYAEEIEYGWAIHNPQSSTEGYTPGTPYAVASLTTQNIPLALERAKKQVLK
jgi:hypothetical protein